MRSFTSSGQLDIIGAQYLNSFLLAIASGKSRIKILPQTDVLISVKYPRQSFLLAVNAAVSLSTADFRGAGVQGCVGPTSLTSTKAVSQIFPLYNTVNINWNSDSEMSLRSNYPYFVRTVPADSFQGVAIADLVGNVFGWSKVTVFSSDDYFGSHCLFEFLNRASTIGVSIVSSYTFRQGILDFSTFISSAKQGGARIFVVLTDPTDASKLLTQGYNA